MVIWRRTVAVELRRRFDSPTAVVGWVSFASVILGVVLLAAIGLAAGHGAVPLSQLVVVGGLPAALGIAFAGVVVGVGDSAWRGDRSIITSGGTGLGAFVARSAVCAVVTALVTVWIALSTAAVAASMAVGGHTLSAAGVGHSLSELTVLLATSAWLGFGFGAATRSRALALVGMPMVLLVGDAALGLGPDWLSAVRFSAVQAFILEGHGVGSALLAAAVWLGVPTAVGAWRSSRCAA